MGPNNCELSIFWFAPFLLLCNILGEIYSNKPRGDPSLLQSLKGLPFESSALSVFRQARRAAAPDFLAVLRSVTFIQLCYPPPNPPRREQYNPTVNRPFLKSGSPKKREGFFVVCSNQHKRRAVLGLKARLLQRRCQSLKAAPLALYRGPSY